ncbi:MAG: 30S ribosomal protein S5, partial [Bdellovibrionales bacterium RIFOXYC2_FULL_39_8]
MSEESNEVVESENGGETENAPVAKSGKKHFDSKKSFAKKPNPNLDPEMEERVVAVNRVAKVVKGGRRFSFSALVVVGDKKGNVGYGLGKAKEVPEAIRKGIQAARKQMTLVPLDKGTIPHMVFGRHDAGYILFKPAAEGCGIKAAGACRSILELAGVKNVLTKSLRGTNSHNVVKA